jgi:hypothetical protein
MSFSVDDLVHPRADLESDTSCSTVVLNCPLCYSPDSLESYSNADLEKMVLSLFSATT